MGRLMNTSTEFFRRREFWAGVAATAVAWIIVAVSFPAYRMSLHKAQWTSYHSQREGYVATALEQVAGGGAGGDQDRFRTFSTPSNPPDRKMIRTASLELLVKNPKETSDKIRLLAEHVGGFLVSSESNGGENASSASLTVRVSSNSFEQVREEVTKLGLRIEGEKLEAQDVTKQYVDVSARLRNLRAEETQYLGILKQAKTVKDTVEVSDKLNEVRGEIEQQQAEFAALSKQVETVALSVSLHAESDAQVFGLHWRPLYQMKLAARDGIDGVADYASSMASFVFYVPAILLWLATVLIGAAIAWRILRWAWRLMFLRPTAA
jgi:uncharacterized protein DUF4349